MSMSNGHRLSLNRRRSLTSPFKISRMLYRGAGLLRLITCQCYKTTHSLQLIQQQQKNWAFLLELPRGHTSGSIFSIAAGQTNPSKNSASRQSTLLKTSSRFLRNKRLEFATNLSVHFVPFGTRSRLIAFWVGWALAAGSQALPASPLACRLRP